MNSKQHALANRIFGSLKNLNMETFRFGWRFAVNTMFSVVLSAMKSVPLLSHTVFLLYDMGYSGMRRSETTIEVAAFQGFSELLYGEVKILK